MDFQLMSGERVIWRGSPAQGIRFQAQDLFIVPFAIIWLTIAGSAFWLPNSDGTQTNDPAEYIILPFFLLIGLYILVGRFLGDMLSRSRTEYALTNRRAIVESGIFRRNTRSINLAATPEIRFRQGRGGRGTIEFGGGSPFAFVPRNWPGSAQFMPPAFDGIEDADNVYRLVLDAQREAQSERA